MAGAVAENLTVPEMWMLAPTVTSPFRWTSRRYPLLHLSRQWSLKTQRQRRAAWRSWQRHGAVMRATSGREIWYGFVVTGSLLTWAVFQPGSVRSNGTGLTVQHTRSAIALRMTVEAYLLQEILAYSVRVKLGGRPVLSACFNTETARSDQKRSDI